MENPRIGTLQLKSPVISAPLAGVSDAAFRYMAYKHGAGMVVSEMVSSRGLAEQDRRTRSLLATHPDARPLAIQVFGHRAEDLSRAAEEVSKLDVDALDLNVGCPVKKILRSGAGGALSKDLPLLESIISGMRKNSRHPFTVKIRAGFDEQSANAVEMARIAEACGADAVTVHPRYVKEGFSGKARWHVIADVVKALKIPVIGNGDIVTAEDAVRMANETGCAAIMLGRGTFGNPFLFREVAAALMGKPAPEPPTAAERLENALVQYDLMVQYTPRVAVRHWRKHLSWYARGLNGAAEFRNAVFKMDDPVKLRSLAFEFFEGRARAREAAPS